MFKNLRDKFNKSYMVINYKKIYPYVRPYKKRALIAILITIPLGMLDAVIAWSLKPFMDSVLIEKSTATTSFVPLFIICFAIMQGFIGYAATYLNAWVGLRITLDLKDKMFSKLMGLDSRFYNNTSSGDVMVRFSGDVDLACNGLLNNTKLFTTRVFSSISLIIVLFINSWQLACVALIVLFGALAPLSNFRQRVKKFMASIIESTGGLVTNYKEAYVGEKIIKSYNLETIQSARFHSKASEIFKATMKMRQRTAFLPPLMTVAVSFGIAFVIWYGSYLIVSGEITGGDFVSFIAALIMLYNPIKTIGNNFSSMQISLMAMERVFEMVEKEDYIQDSKNAVEIKEISKSIEYKDVKFGYTDDKQVLKGVNLNIKVGENIAFVGNSGGGKSTIANLLPRFYEINEGSILIDGKDIKDIKVKSLRDNISVVFQDSFLFTGTIKDNITLGADVTEEQLNNVLKSACLDEFIASLDDGINSQVGEAGTLLSGGQKQRISIARALLKNAPIVILDEATSALDNKSEKVVQQAINNLMEGKTVLIIAHRLSTIKNADRIVVINNGEIAEIGSHDELLDKENGVYSSLYLSQK